MIYIPDKWLLVKISPKGEDSIYKVFATWSGGYLDGDSWRLNSGIVDITANETSFQFHGYSGSEYDCSKASYGCTQFGWSTITNYQNKLHESTEHKLEILSEEEALEYIKGELNK